MKALIRPILALFCMTSMCLAADPAPREFKGATPLQWSIRMADSQMARRGDGMVYVEGGRKRWDYADNVFLMSLIRLGEKTKDAKYAKLADRVISSFTEPDGTIKTFKKEDYNLDNINPGKTVMALYRVSKDDGYSHALRKLREQLDTHPRTASGGYWHKQIYPNQMWLDGLYMSGPFRAEYAQVFEEPDQYDDIAKQFTLIAEHTYDPKTGLFYHGWDESKQQDWADKQTGRSPNFWSRAIGWYAMALVDTLDYFPANHPQRAKLIDLLNKVSAGIVKNQDASGLWWQVTDQGSREGNYLEATASCMFVYTMAKAMNKGYISKDYLAPTLKGYTGIVEKLITVNDSGAVTLTKCCSVAGLSAGRNGSFEYYIKEPIVDNDMKGVGPFVFAGMELQQLLGIDAAK